MQKRNEPKVKLVGYLTEKQHISERVIDPVGGVAFTIMAQTHGYGQGYIIEREADKHDDKGIQH